MSDAVNTAPARLSFLARLVLLPFYLFGVLCGALLLSITIEWIGLACFWPEQGEGHAQAMLDAELAQLSGHFRRSVLVSEPGRMARSVAAAAQEGLFVHSGLAQWRRESAERAGGRGFRDQLGRAYARAEPYVAAAAYIVLVVLVRLVVLALTLPLFLLAAWIGFVDGLARRDLRKFGAGRESGYLYHRARASLSPLLTLPPALYLAWPVSVHPLWILLPAALLLCLVADLMAGSFKKYV